MAKLEDFDKNKIVSFRYASIDNTSSIPQTFEDGHSGYVVTGTRDLIHEKFLESSGRVKAEATTFDPGADTPIMEETFTQIYNVTNPAGSYTITGLKGDFGFSESDLMMENSLILSTWKNKVDAHTLRAYAAPLIKNHTTGVREMPIVIRDFGSGSVEAKGIRFGSGKPGFTVELQRGGNAVGDIVDNYTDIVTKNSFWSRFVDKQSDLQDYAIMRGGGTFGDAPFDTFDGLTFQLGFEPGVRTYRNAGIISGVARYTDNVPFVSNRYYNTDFTSPLGDAEIGSDIDVEDWDYTKDPKMLFLYKKWILPEEPMSEPAEPGSLQLFINTVSDRYPSAAANAGSSFLSNLFPSSVEDPLNPYPIVPVLNVVNSPRLGSGMFGNDLKISDDTVNTGQAVVYNGKDPGWMQAPLSYVSSSMAFMGDVNEFGIQKAKTLIGAAGTLLQKLKGLDPSDGPTKDNNTEPEKPIPEPVTTEVWERKKKLDYAKGPELIKDYTTLGYSDLTMVEPTLAYGKTLKTPTEWVSTDMGHTKDSDLKDLIELNSENQPIGGSRHVGQKKVYDTGTKGFRGVTQSPAIFPTPTVTEVVDDALGRIKTDNTGGDNKYKTDFTDNVNLIPYNSTLSGKATTGEDPVDLDFVPLVFYDVYNKRDIVFRSILGDITDTITPNWSEENFIGRPIGVANYKGVGRSIGFNFEVYPKTKQEFPVLLEKVNYLVGLCYPHLDKYYRQTGPMIRLTLGDIVQKQLGYISACTVTFPEASPWETDPGLRFTKQISIDLTFEYIGGYIPVATGKHYGLDWLDGTTYDAASGVAFEKFPNRNHNNTDMRKLFKELGQE